tara:strand:+ start:17566 stop:19299 length:1734 start_codon:yes stop_codon:yes gene_type:complete
MIHQLKKKNNPLITKKEKKSSSFKSNLQHKADNSTVVQGLEKFTDSKSIPQSNEGIIQTKPKKEKVVQQEIHRTGEDISELFEPKVHEEEGKIVPHEEQQFASDIEIWEKTLHQDLSSSSLSEDEKKVHREQMQVIKRDLISRAFLGIDHKKDDGTKITAEEKLGRNIPLAAYLSHGDRHAYQSKDKAVGEEFRNELMFGGKQINQVNLEKGHFGPDLFSNIMAFSTTGRSPRGTGTRALDPKKRVGAQGDKHIHAGLYERQSSHEQRRSKNGDWKEKKGDPKKTAGGIGAFISSIFPGITGGIAGGAAGSIGGAITGIGGAASHAIKGKNPIEGFGEHVSKGAKGGASFGFKTAGLIPASVGGLAGVGLRKLIPTSTPLIGEKEMDSFAKSNTDSLGMNIPIGGIGNTAKHGDNKDHIIGPEGIMIDPNTGKVLKNKQHGHVYMKHNSDDKGTSTMVGYEGSAPNTDSMHGSHGLQSMIDGNDRTITGQHKGKLFQENLSLGLGGMTSEVNRENLDQLKEVFKKFEKIESVDKEEANKLISKLLKSKNVDERKSVIREINNSYKNRFKETGELEFI